MASCDFKRVGSRTTGTRAAQAGGEFPEEPGTMKGGSTEHQSVAACLFNHPPSRFEIDDISVGDDLDRRTDCLSDLAGNAVIAFALEALVGIPSVHRDHGDASPFGGLSKGDSSRLSTAKADPHFDADRNIDRLADSCDDLCGSGEIV